MGAQQSSHNGGSSAPKITRTCYYDLLEVDRLATDEELKKAYRRKALELHPDRNIGNAQEATNKFAEVQAAYDILSDPQERAWYDSHRDTILSGGDAFDDDDSIPPSSVYRNVRLTSTEEIMSLIRRFNARVPLDDSPSGFFRVIGETFDHLALEEEAAAEFERIDCPSYPTFGSSNDDYIHGVRDFYTAWANFATKKSFAWKDKYRLSEAPDRRTRRLMEKENSRLRHEAGREFNEAVRFLVTFIRKRDPRYSQNIQTEAERQKTIRSAAAAQAARSRASNQERLAASEVPNWAWSRDDDFEIRRSTAPLSSADENSDSDSQVEIFECVVCRKTFKSEKQLEAHERSKKHLKALQQLTREMVQQDFIVNGRSQTEQKPSKPPQDLEAVTPSQDIQTDSLERLPNDHVSEQRGADSDADFVSSSSSGDGDRNTSQSGVQDDFVGVARFSEDNDADLAIKDQNNKTFTQIPGDDSQPDSRPKRGKAKLKREKRAYEQLQDHTVLVAHRCSTCGDQFQSRNKLFHHIRQNNHTPATQKLPIRNAKKRY